MSTRCDPIIAGMEFSGAIFLRRYLQHSPTGARVLLLERGASDDNAPHTTLV
jgi:hypothetical protein